MTDSYDAGTWREVLAFWFPEGRASGIDSEHHAELWRWRLHGGADQGIAARFAHVTAMAAEGALDHWAAEPEGRLALTIALDQFPRSLWRGTPRAYAQDRAALALALAGLENGHYAAQPAPWFQIAFTQPLGHAEGPDHLERIGRLIVLREEIATRAPEPLRPIYDSLVAQARQVRLVIASFGRHPHRNAVLRRTSTPAEAAYLARGKFPHLRAFRQ